MAPEGGSGPEAAKRRLLVQGEHEPVRAALCGAAPHAFCRAASVVTGGQAGMPALLPPGAGACRVVP